MKVKERKEIMGLWDSRKIDAFIDYLNELKKTLEESGVENIEIEMDEKEYPWSDPSYAVFVRWEREETQEEKENRENAEASLKEAARLRELKMLAELQAKYGNGN